MLCDPPEPLVLLRLTLWSNDCIVEVTKLGSCSERTRGPYVGKQAAITEQQLSISAQMTLLTETSGDQYVRGKAQKQEGLNTRAGTYSNIDRQSPAFRHRQD